MTMVASPADQPTGRRCRACWRISGPGKIDVIVVYKVDRLTRSLADFAKLVELFDAHGVSFVSVTQQFNTTTSMGRLTLNVLLSFAQFEREVTSERIRDKIAASKQKGIWVGGPLPLGYAMENGKMAVVPEEAERVRHIFRRYLELGSVHALMRDLRDRNIVTRQRLLTTGATRGGVPFGWGALFYLLRNRFYIGEVNYKGEILPGRAARDHGSRPCSMTFSRSLRTSGPPEARIRNAGNHLLTGLLFDDAGHRMAPTHAKGLRYRYYVSLPASMGSPRRHTVGSISRVPAADLEDTIVKALDGYLIAQKEKPASGSAQAGNRKAVLEQVARIDVHKDRLVIQFRSETPTKP